MPKAATFDLALAGPTGEKRSFYARRKPITNDLAFEDDGSSAPLAAAAPSPAAPAAPAAPTAATTAPTTPAKHETIALSIAIRGEHLPLRALAAFAPHAIGLADAHAGGVVAIKRRTTRAVLAEAPSITRSSLELTIDGTIDGLVVEHESFAAAPVTLAGTVHASLTISPEAIAVSRAALDVGAIHLQTSGWIRRGSPWTGQIDATLAPAPCADLMSSLPETVRGPLDGMVVTGTFGGRARLAVDLTATSGDGVALSHTFTGGCGVAAEPPAADVTSLATPSEQQLADGTRARIGKGEPGYVELHTLPGYVAGAFVAAEDGRFWTHAGFDLEQIAKSLEIDLREHRIARGGSTITQQLVKNAFLVQRRSFDRKLQEAVLAWRVEERLAKKQIMERYLNIIELGPHVFGVEAAAKYWFGVSAAQLTVRQAAFLAALTSQPTAMGRRIRHANGTDPETAERIRVVLGGMRRDGAIDWGMHESAKAETLRFRPDVLRDARD